MLYPIYGVTNHSQVHFLSPNPVNFEVAIQFSQPEVMLLSNSTKGEERSEKSLVNTDTGYYVAAVIHFFLEQCIKN